MLEVDWIVAIAIEKELRNIQKNGTCFEINLPPKYKALDQERV